MPGAAANPYAIGPTIHAALCERRCASSVYTVATPTASAAWKVMSATFGHFASRATPKSARLPTVSVPSCAREMLRATASRESLWRASIHRVMRTSAVLSATEPPRKTADQIASDAVKRLGFGAVLVCAASVELAMSSSAARCRERFMARSECKRKAAWHLFRTGAHGATSADGKRTRRYGPTGG